MLIKRYTELLKLNAKALNELIYCIVIYQTQTDENGLNWWISSTKFVELVKIIVD